MSRTTNWITGAAFVLTAIIVQHYFMGRAVTGLSVGVVIAFAIWLTDNTYSDRVRWDRVRLIYGIAVVVQALHLFEEYHFGFQREYPAFWGYEWGDGRFLLFNLSALGVFVLAWIGLAFGVRLALLVVWVMAVIGGIGNGIFHIALTVSNGEYFPGSISAAVHLALGVLLVRALLHRVPNVTA